MGLAQKPVAIICAKGMGDALIFMILAYHLSLHHIPVILYSDKLLSFQSWFPKVLIAAYPKFEDLAVWRETVGKIICANHPDFEARLVGQAGVIHFGRQQFNREQTAVKNVVQFCKQEFQLEGVTAANGIEIPPHLGYRRYPARVVIHPTSSDGARKDWPAHKFQALARRLKKAGFEPVFAVAPNERALWQARLLGETLPEFPGLGDLAAFIYESGSLIGNDSGLGHLASLLNIPTISIFSQERTSLLWRPDWRPGIVVFPKISGIFRRQWRLFISVRQVYRAFLGIQPE